MAITGTSWTTERARWRSTHVLVVVSCSTHGASARGNRPPYAYQIHWRTEGRLCWVRTSPTVGRSQRRARPLPAAPSLDVTRDGGVPLITPRRRAHTSHRRCAGEGPSVQISQVLRHKGPDVA